MTANKKNIVLCLYLQTVCAARRWGHVTALVITAALVLNACSSLPEHAGENPVTPVRQSSDTERKESVTQVPEAEQQPVQQSEAVVMPQEEAMPDPGSLVYFDWASAETSVSSQKTFQDVAKKLGSNRRLTVTLIGRADRLASKELCIAIASKRIRLVSAELVARGVKASQIRQYTRGCETTGSHACLSETCRRLRRSVELKIGE